MTMKALGSHSEKSMPAARFRKRVWRAAARSLENEKRDTAPDETGGQRDYDIRYARYRDKDAVRRTQQRSDGEDEDRKQQRFLERGMLHQPRRKHVGNGDDRADRKIDAAANDHDRLRGGGHGQRQGAERQGLQVERAEIRMDEGGGEDTASEDERHAELADPLAD